jgi:hypothetical protein
VHAEDDGALDEPAGQEVHALAPPVLNVPAAHAVQVDTLTVAEKRPAAQIEHDEAPGALEVPGVHGEHED